MLTSLTLPWCNSTSSVQSTCCKNHMHYLNQIKSWVPLKMSSEAVSKTLCLNHPPPSALIRLPLELFTRLDLTKIENLSTALLASIYSSMLHYDWALSQLLLLLNFQRSNTFHNIIFNRALPKLEPTATVIGGYNSWQYWNLSVLWQALQLAKMALLMVWYTTPHDKHFISWRQLLPWNKAALPKCVISATNVVKLQPLRFNTLSLFKLVNVS
jgi:hypothetical protein